MTVMNMDKKKGIRKRQKKKGTQISTKDEVRSMERKKWEGETMKEESMRVLVNNLTERQLSVKTAVPA